MKKVIEFLNKHFETGNDFHYHFPLKKNMTFSIDEYLNNIYQVNYGSKFSPFKTEEKALYCSINNETIWFIYKFRDEKLISHLPNYSYLQTYKHLPRVYRDKYGYYVRSTDEEIINYIKLYMNVIDPNYFRLKKFKKIIE